jgi:hypothetical protein
LHSPLAELAKRQAHSDQEMPKRLAPVKREVLLATLQENLLAEVMRLLSDVVRPEQANWRLPADLDLRQTEQHSVRAVRRRLPAGRARLQELRLRRAGRFPVPPARARRYSKDPGPYAFFREILAAQKYNRAVRCGGRPISAQYRPPRTRRALAGCDNRCSRSQHKRGRPVRPFQIGAGDKHRCHPLPFADRDVRFANSE